MSLPMPCPSKSTSMETLERCPSSRPSTVTSTVARIGPSMPRTPQLRGGSTWVTSEVNTRWANPIRRVMRHLSPTAGVPLVSMCPVYDAVLPLGEPGRVGDVGEHLVGPAVDLHG